jgi:hypothetical protein
MITSLYRSQSSYLSKADVSPEHAPVISAAELKQDVFSGTQSKRGHKSVFSYKPNTYKSQIHFGDHLEAPQGQWRFNRDGKLVPSLSHLNNIMPSDVEDYLLSNFGQDDILLEDKEIIEKLIGSLTKGGLLRSLQQRFGKDIHAGEELLFTNVGHADLYPGLLLNGIARSFNTENYKIDLVDSIRSSRELVERSLYGTKPSDLPFQEMMWNKFRDFMAKKGGKFWDNPFEDLRKHSQIIQNGVQYTPKERYHAAFLFFPKTITDSERDFEQAIQSHVNSVKTGGLVAGAMMLRSTEWKMGRYWQPELVPLTKELVENAFKKAGVDITVTKLDAPPAIRDGYEGILVYTGIKQDKNSANQ